MLSHWVLLGWTWKQERPATWLVSGGRGPWADWAGAGQLLPGRGFPPTGNWGEAESGGEQSPHSGETLFAWDTGACVKTLLLESWQDHRNGSSDMGQFEKPAITEGNVASVLWVALAGKGTEPPHFGDKENIPTNTKGTDRSICCNENQSYLHT